jgi:hypothetical protein
MSFPQIIIGVDIRVVSSVCAEENTGFIAQNYKHDSRWFKCEDPIKISAIYNAWKRQNTLMGPILRK